MRNVFSWFRGQGKELAEDFHQPSKYADAETLKQSSGSDQFMNQLSPKDRWIENCADCKVPMKMVYVPPEAISIGVVDSVRGVHPSMKALYKAYMKWAENPVINPAAEFWYCECCESVWTIESSFWTKVLVRGNLRVEPSRVKPVIVPVAPQDEVYNGPGVKPSEDSTLCPSCQLWRTVEPYDGTIRQGETYVQHVCPKCKAVDIVRAS